MDTGRRVDPGRLRFLSLVTELWVLPSTKGFGARDREAGEVVLLMLLVGAAANSRLARLTAPIFATSIVLKGCSYFMLIIACVQPLAVER